jgi:chemotaxis protein CheZ
MASPAHSAATATIGASVPREVAGAQALLETYRAQIEQCEKLKVELDLIHDAISRTKREIAVLHGKSFNGEEMAKVTGELGAVVGGTEHATQQILEAAEAIDQAATALAKVTSPDQQKILSEEIQERVVSIFEACNFQDLTGQRINKVMATMKFIENHITVMMDIWGGVDAIKAHAPPIADARETDARLLNGPKTDGDVGHASQDDIDALFD